LKIGSQELEKIGSLQVHTRYPELGSSELIFQ